MHIQWCITLFRSYYSITSCFFRKRLEEMIEQLKLKLQETLQKLNILQLDNGELELEHEGLQTRHNQFVQEVTEKETGWKQRYKRVSVK